MINWRGRSCASQERPQVAFHHLWDKKKKHDVPEDGKRRREAVIVVG